MILLNDALEMACSRGCYSFLFLDVLFFIIIFVKCVNNYLQTLTMAPIFTRISLLATTAAAFVIQNHNGVPVPASFARTHALAAASNDIPAGPEKKYCHPRSISFGATPVEPAEVGRIVKGVKEEQEVGEQVERQVIARVVQLVEEDQEVIEQVVSVAIEPSIYEDKKILGIKAAIEKEMREAIARAETGGKKYCHPKTISCFEAKEVAGVVEEASFAEPVNSKPLKKYCHPKPISFRGPPIVYTVKKVAARFVVTANPVAAPAIPAHVAVNAPTAQEKKNSNYFKIVKKIQKIAKQCLGNRSTTCR